MMQSLPTIPQSAPFNDSQRLWLNGYLAGLLSSESLQEKTSSSTLTKVRIPVIYASQSGNSESLAENFSESLVENGYESPCISAEDFSQISLVDEKFLLVISSTWGEGDPPDNAIEFWNTLQSEEHPSLPNLNYAVLALGDSNYLDFCKQGIAFDSRLEALGAKRLAPRVDCDTDFDEPAESWFQTVVSKLGELKPSGKAEALKPAPSQPTAHKTSLYSKNNPFPSKLIENRKLNASESERDTRHFAFDLTGSELVYEAGDVLGVVPRNNPSLVNEMISALAFSPNESIGEATLKEGLTQTFDIQTLSAKTITDWSTVSESGFLKDLISSEDRSAMEDFIWGRNLIDLVTEHPAKFSSAAEFCKLLRKLGPRLYSIASSPKAHPQEVHLCVAKVAYQSHGRNREGVCSTFLSDRVNNNETVDIFFQSAAHFKLPTDLSTDVIMCGPGTGIAPFRAFLEERKATESQGKNWLFFGNPHESTDFLYKEDLLSMKEDGTLHRLDLAWSRDGNEKIYVQNRMLENGAELWSWLEGGAHFYVCGDAKRMAKDVDDTLHQIAITHGAMSQEAAADYIKGLKKSKRYQRDVY